MQIAREQVLELLRQRGDHDTADRAAAQLPAQVDTDQHADVLRRLGIDPAQLGGAVGGLGGPVGDIAGRLGL